MKMNEHQPSTTLNSGGMAEVSLCALRSDHGVQRLCVAKKLLPHLSANQAYQELLINEARLLQHLQHRNIVQIFGVRKFQESLVVLLEYVHGVDLRVLMDQCRAKSVPLPVPLILHIGSEVANGLHQAYESINPQTNNKLHVVHRDVSPSNIMLSATGEIKITDFGIAENIRLESSLLMDRVSGKEYYMSPEQRLGKQCTAQSDIYSLGCVLWEMLSGKRFLDSHPQSLRGADCDFGSLHGANPAISQEIDAIVVTCLRQDPGSRFASARDLRKALEDIAQQQFIPFVSEEVAVFVQGVCGERLQNMANLARQVLSESSSAVIDMSSGNPDSKAENQEVLFQDKTVITGPGEEKEFIVSAASLAGPTLRLAPHALPHPSPAGSDKVNIPPTFSNSSNNSMAQIVFRDPSLQVESPRYSRSRIRVIIGLCIFGFSIWLLTALLKF